MMSFSSPGKEPAAGGGGDGDELVLVQLCEMGTGLIFEREGGLIRVSQVDDAAHSASVNPLARSCEPPAPLAAVGDTLVAINGEHVRDGLSLDEMKCKLMFEKRPIILIFKRGRKNSGNNKNGEAIAEPISPSVAKTNTESQSTTGEIDQPEWLADMMTHMSQADSMPSVCLRQILDSNVMPAKVTVQSAYREGRNTSCDRSRKPPTADIRVTTSVVSDVHLQPQNMVQRGADAGVDAGGSAFSNLTPPAMPLLAPLPQICCPPTRETNCAMAGVEKEQSICPEMANRSTNITSEKCDSGIVLCSKELTSEVPCLPPVVASPGADLTRNDGSKPERQQGTSSPIMRQPENIQSVIQKINRAPLSVENLTRNLTKENLRSILQLCDKRRPAHRKKEELVAEVFDLCTTGRLAQALGLSTTEENGRSHQMLIMPAPSCGNPNSVHFEEPDDNWSNCSSPSREPPVADPGFAWQNMEAAFFPLVPAPPDPGSTPGTRKISQSTGLQVFKDFKLGDLCPPSSRKQCEPATADAHFYAGEQVVIKRSDRKWKFAIVLAVRKGAIDCVVETDEQGYPISKEVAHGELPQKILRLRQQPP
jgi:hypothetical protein